MLIFFPCLFSQIRLTPFVMDSSMAIILGLAEPMGLHVLGPFLVDHFKSNHWTRSSIILAPMPISKRRRFQRGYNQCHSIAEGCKKSITSAGFQCVVRPLLRKVKHRRSQIHFSAMDRWTNTSNSLRVRKKNSASLRMRCWL